MLTSLLLELKVLKNPSRENSCSLQEHLYYEMYLGLTFDENCGFHSFSWKKVFNFNPADTRISRRIIQINKSGKKATFIYEATSIWRKDD